MCNIYPEIRVLG